MTKEIKTGKGGGGSKELVLVVEPLRQMQNIVFNYEEIKKGLQLKLEDYRGMTYTDDSIDVAKKDRAELNKLKKTLSDERIKIKRLYNQPVEVFESKIKELVSLIDEPIDEIGMQINKYEDEAKEKKKNEILDWYSNKEISKEVEIAKIWNDRWLNKSFSISKIIEEVDEFASKYEADVKAIKALNSDEEPILLEEYRKTLDLSSVLAKQAELEREKKLREEQERVRAEQERERAEQAEKDRLKAEEERLKAEAVKAKIAEMKGQKSVFNSVPAEKEEEQEIIVVEVFVKSRTGLAELEEYLKTAELDYNVFDNGDEE